MKKVCFIIDDMGPGGAERVISLLAKFMVNQGLEVEILMISTNKIQSFYELDDKVKLSLLINEGAQVPKTFKRVRLIKKHLKKYRPDYVISFLPHVNVYAHFATRNLNVKHIVSERSNPYIYPKSRIHKLLRNHAFKHADACVLQTKDALKYFNKKVQAKSVIIKNPLRPISDRYQIKFEEREHNRIVAVGNFKKDKNYPLLLNAFYKFSQKLPHYVLEIYGQGALEGEINKIIAQLNISDKVTLKGLSDDIIDSIYDAGMYVLSSSNEGMPNSLMEAMALGIPSISTDCPIWGPREIIDDYKNGILVEVDNVDELVEAMELLHNDKELAKTISLNATKIKDKLFLEKIGQKWVNLLSSLEEMRERNVCEKET